MAYTENLGSNKTSIFHYVYFEANTTTTPVIFNGDDASSTSSNSEEQASFFVLVMNGTSTNSQISGQTIDHTGTSEGFNGLIKPGDVLQISLSNINPGSETAISVTYDVVNDAYLTQYGANGGTTSHYPGGGTIINTAALGGVASATVDWTVPSIDIYGNPVSTTSPDLSFEIVNYNNANTTYTLSITDLGQPQPKPTVPATSVQQEILGLYAALYNRATDSNGLAYWAGEVGQQPDGTGVTTANAGSTAITTNDATVLGQAFVNTQATYFNTTYGNLSDSDFITALYVNLSGNATNIAAGIAYWANILQTAEAGGQSVQAARAGLVGQIVHDMIDYDVSVPLPGYTTAQWQAVVQRQETIDNKIAVSLALSNASQGPGGGILVAHTVGDAAFNASTAILQGITYDSATVTAAITGINNAVAHQDLSLI